MQFPRPQVLRGYGVALGCIMLATVVRSVLEPYAEGLPIFGMFLVAIVISSRVGGLGPGIFAMLLGMLPAIYLYDDWPPSFLDSEMQIRLGVYILLGLIILGMSEAEHKASQALKAEKDLLRQAIEFQEGERRLIAFDIHDGTIQYATAALLFLESYQAKHLAESEIKHFKPIITSLRHTIQEARRVIHGLRSPTLDEDGIVKAIEEMVLEKSSPSFEIDFTHKDDIGRMRPALESAIYRITQEILNNAFKHSQSPRLAIRLTARNHRIWLFIQDWGVGFTPNHVERGVHGLSGIKERVLLQGGHFKCKSELGRGTQFEIDLPYIPI